MAKKYKILNYENTCFCYLTVFIITASSEFYLKFKVLVTHSIRSNILYGYAPKINQKKYRIKNSKITINDRGLRTIFNWNEKRNNKIIFLGDSVTYGGSYIDDTKLFSHIVCEKIKSYLCGNAGVNSYGVYNTVMRSKFDERIQDGDIFVYIFPPDDFLRDYRNSNTAHFYLNNKKFFLPALTEAINFFSIKYDINNLISKKNDTITNNKSDIHFIRYSINILNEELMSKIDNGKKVVVILSNRKNDKNLTNKMNNFIKKELSNKIKILYIHVIQPNLYLENSKILSPSETKLLNYPKYGDIISNHYKIFDTEYLNADKKLDLKYVFKKNSQELYRDYCCHLNNLGMHIISMEIIKNFSSDFENFIN